MLVCNRSSRCRSFELGTDVYNLVPANRTPATSLITTNKTSSTTNTVNPAFRFGLRAKSKLAQHAVNVGINESSRVEEDEMRIDLLVHIATREWRDKMGISFEFARLSDDVILDGLCAPPSNEGNRRWRVDSTSNTNHAHPPLPRFFLLQDTRPLTRGW